MFEGQDRLFPGGLDLVPLPDTGHFMQWEKPETFARLLLEFLEP